MSKPSLRTRDKLAPRSIRTRVSDAKPQGTNRPTLTATQARLSQSDARACDGDVLDDFVFTVTARARYRFGVSFNDGRADDGQRPFC